jgi:16S rRNA processing protein RimM
MMPGNEATDDGSLLTIAHITRPQGLRGDVRIRIDFDDPALFDPGRETLLVLGAKSEPATIEACRMQHGRWVAKFAGIESIDDAESWVGARVCIPRGQIPEAGDGEYFSFDLEGCTVYAESAPIGVVVEVMDSGGGTMLRLDRSGIEVLVPFVREYLKNVNITEKRIDVELPDGLAKLNG